MLPGNIRITRGIRFVEADNEFVNSDDAVKKHPAMTQRFSMTFCPSRQGVLRAFCQYEIITESDGEGEDALKLPLVAKAGLVDSDDQTD